MPSRTDRLLKLLQLLRASRHPKSARLLAQELGISVRSVYRDIDTLRGQGAVIGGEAGVGFVLQQDCNLPPLMFSENELEALMLGMRWAAAHADGEMAEAARSVLGKVHAVLPARLAEQAAAHAVYPMGGTAYGSGEEQVLALVRQALRQETELSFSYTDLQGQASRRTVWPVALGYLDEARLLAAWCTLRQAFRHFRCDRITQAQIGAAYPMPHRLLLQRWRQQEGLDLSAFDLSR